MSSKVHFCCSVPKSWPSLCDTMDCSTPGFSVLHHLPELAQTHVHQVMMDIHHGNDAIQPSHPQSPPSLLSPVFPRIKIFSSESALHIRQPKYWSFSISPSNEYSGLIYIRMDWLDLLAVQGTFKGLLQHHSSEALILPCSAFFMVQISHPHITTGKL